MEKATACVLLGIAVVVNAAEYLLNRWSELGWYDVVHGYTIFDLVWDSLGALAAGVVALVMARN